MGGERRRYSSFEVELAQGIDNTTIESLVKENIRSDDELRRLC